MNYPPVLSKRDFTERYARGEFGNASPTWHTPDEFNSYVGMLRMELNGLYHLRNRTAGGETFYNLTLADVLIKWSNVKDRDNWYVSAMAPTEKTLIQGELCESTEGLYLYYSSEPRPMREALALSHHHSCGIMTICLLRRYMNPVSFDWTMELLHRYPEHVIEFSVYGCEWGTLPGYNTVWWEIRRY